MKNTLVALLLLIPFFGIYSQNLSFDVHGKYSRPMQKEKLKLVSTMNDLSPGYPSSWITDYVSAQVSATCKGVVVTAEGLNDTLTPGQKEIMINADMGTDIVVSVKYKYTNTITGLPDIMAMNFTVTIVPEKEAEYRGGFELLKKYLKENAVDKIPVTDSQNKLHAVVLFTINETGEITNAQISTSSGHKEVDTLLLNAINKMPKWIPAHNGQGVKVKQKFEFTVGNGGC